MQNSIAATPIANLNLIVQLVMGGALLLGAFLARRKRFKAHGICQSSVVLLNLIPILLFMHPVFRRAVLPAIPGQLSDPFYSLPAAHAAIGTVAELMGLYIIACAGTGLIPERFRFQNYKVWMRTELVLWWLAIALGIVTYGNWYRVDRSEGQSENTATPATFTPQRATPTQGEAGVAAIGPAATITMSNFSFEPAELEIAPGTTVIWKDAIGKHSVKADDGSFESEILAAGGEFKHTFETEGRYQFYCTLHGSPEGHDMAGVVIVKRRP